MVFFLYNLFSNDSTLQQYILQCPEHLACKHNAAHTSTAKLERILSGINLRHNLSEEQKQECKDYRDDKELKPIGFRTKLHDSGKNIVEEHDNGDIHKVIGYQYGSQCTF